MNETDIKSVLESKNVIEFVRKIHKFYPNGFDKEKIDERLRKKLIELEEKFNKYNNSDIIDEPKRNS